MLKRKDYDAALHLRLQGKTYGEIKDVLKIPKSTQSYWFKHLDLPLSAQTVLKTKERKGLQALAVCNQERTVRIEKENETIRLEYESAVKNINDRDLMLIGTALYWGEGYKNFAPGLYRHIAFANSDPCMILTFLLFLKRILKVDLYRIKAEIMIFPGADLEAALRYWQKLTQIPLENFHTYIALSSASRGKRPKNLLPYGTLQIRVNSRREFFKIRGLMDGIIERTSSDS